MKSEEFATASVNELTGAVANSSLFTLHSSLLHSLLRHQETLEVGKVLRHFHALFLTFHEVDTLAYVTSELCIVGGAWKDVATVDDEQVGKRLVAHEGVFLPTMLHGTIDKEGGGWILVGYAGFDGASRFILHGRESLGSNAIVLEDHARIEVLTFHFIDIQTGF